MWKGIAQTEIEKAWATPAVIVGVPSQKILPPIPFDVASVKRGETYKGLQKAGLSEYEAKEQLREDFRNALGMKAGETSIILTDPIGEAGVFNDTLAEHILNKKDGREAFFSYVRPTYEEAYEVWLVRTQAGQIRKQYIRYYQDEKGRRFLVSMDFQRGIWVGYNAFPSRQSSYIDNIRKSGELLYRRE
ncbi:MAG: PBECR2 nuclease fold domain-containing protein [Pseudomonadota bacterium]